MRITAQEDELKLFRDLGEQQNCMNSKVGDRYLCLPIGRSSPWPVSAPVSSRQYKITKISFLTN